MADPATDASPAGSRPPNRQPLARHAWEAVRRAFVQFLTISTALIALFLLLAAASYVVDEIRVTRTGEAVGLFGSKLFSDPEKSADLLGAIATSIITVTSITFSLLLIAVQQGAATLTSQIFDQFLRRKINQIYFGFFIGLALYCLITLAGITPSHSPVYGVTLAFLMMVAALYMLTMLIYQTIDQMRPVTIIDAIFEYTLSARRRQRNLLRNTRRSPALRVGAVTPVYAETGGFLTYIDLDVLAAATVSTAGDLEIYIRPSIGDYVSYGDVIVDIRTANGTDTSALASEVLKALRLEVQRDLDTDPSFGIQQLAMIGWTTTSTAKSNPEPGQLACWKLCDIVAHMIELDGEETDGSAEDPLPIVYTDAVLERAINAFESLVVVASESMQHQTVSEIYRALTILYPRLPAAFQDRVEDLLLRSLTALGDHVPTSSLEDALSGLVAALQDAGRFSAAAAIEAAQSRFVGSVGTLGSRATRSTSAGLS
jgi:hypothetical protein